MSCSRGHRLPRMHRASLYPRREVPCPQLNIPRTLREPSIFVSLTLRNCPSDSGLPFCCVGVSRGAASLLEGLSQALARLVPDCPDPRHVLVGEGLVPPSQQGDG